jgi:chromosome segregation ATPase
MKNFQQSLLIVLALGLCVLCAWQWNFQTVQRDRIDRLDQQVFKQAVAIQGYTNSIAGMEAEIAGQQERINELKKTIGSNDDIIISGKRDALRLQLTVEGMSNEIAQYQALTNLLAGKLTEAYDGIRKQNEAISNLVTQRDEFIAKYTNSVNARNDVVVKYNDLVQQMKKLEDAQNANRSK